jgi:hypothetical protein
MAHRRVTELDSCFLFLVTTNNDPLRFSFLGFENDLNNHNVTFIVNAFCPDDILTVELHVVDNIPHSFSHDLFALTSLFAQLDLVDPNLNF